MLAAPAVGARLRARLDLSVCGHPYRESVFVVAVARPWLDWMVVAFASVCVAAGALLLDLLL